MISENLYERKNINEQKTTHEISCAKTIFLNRDLEMRAFAIGIVQDTREIPNTDEKNWEWATIELTLSDCVRQVSYDFNLNTTQIAQTVFTKSDESPRSSMPCAMRSKSKPNQSRTKNRQTESRTESQKRGRLIYKSVG